MNNHDRFQNKQQHQTWVNIYSQNKEIELQRQLSYNKSKSKVNRILGGYINIVKISCGYDFTLVLDANNNLHSFGNNKYGQLGYGDCNENINQLRLVKFNKKIIIDQIRCGFSHAIVFNKKQAYGWGEHEHGALGFDPVQIINPWTPRKLSILVASSQELLDISCGNNTSFINVSGDLYAMGDNKCKQLGLILRKSYFEFQKIQIANQNQDRVKLIQVRAGDGFTVGMDKNGCLYGAGQFSKLGLFLRYNNSLSNGFCRLEEHTDAGYRQLRKVQNFHCGTNLIIQFTNKQIAAFGYNNRSIRIKNVTNLKILAHCQEFVLLRSISDNNIYKWDSFNNSIIQFQEIQTKENQIKQISTQQQKSIISCQSDGKLVKISTQREQKRQYNKMDILSKQSEQILKKIEIINGEQEQQKYEDKKLQQFEDKIKNNQRYKQQRNSKILNEIQGENARIIELQKQLTQQKQIIRLYQLYVAKLEMENKELKQKLLVSQLQQIQSQSSDKIGNGLAVLKQMLRDMIESQQNDSKF